MNDQNKLVRKWKNTGKFFKMNVCIQDVTGWTDLAHQICSEPNINFATVSRMYRGDLIPAMSKS